MKKSNISMRYALGEFSFPTKEAEEQAKKVFYENKSKPRKKKTVDSNLKNKQSKYKQRTKYSNYMESTKWFNFRKLIIDQRGYACEKCHTTTPPIHLHHITYVRVGHEFPQDVKLLCESCHEKVHGRREA